MMRAIALLTFVAFTAPVFAQEATPTLPPTSPLAPPAATPVPVGIQEPPPDSPAPPKPPALPPPPPLRSKAVWSDLPPVPDEPLPRWTPPPMTPRENRRALFLQMAPEVQQAQLLRQAGLWVSSFGWAGLFAGGILYGHTNGNKLVTGIAATHQGGGINSTYYNGGIGLMVGGAAVALVGVTLFVAGQWRLSAWHKKRPKDTMPSFSGF
jgi:hypothetical protein